MLSAYKRIEKIPQITEGLIAARYKASYNEVLGRLAKLYAQIGDTPTLQEAKRYNRLVNLFTAIEDEYRRLNRGQTTVMERALIRTYTEAAYSTQWATIMDTGVNLRFPVIPVDAVRAAVWNEISGTDFSKRLIDNTKKNVKRLREDITRALIQGEPFARTARTMKADFQSGYSDAVRVLRTEAMRDMTEGHLSQYDAAQELGVKMRKRWVATLDDRTRVDHARLDGEYANDDGLFEFGGMTAEGPGLWGDPAMDINCRCRVVEEVEGLEPELRRIRDEGVVEYKTYAQWAEPKGWTAEKGWPVQTRV